MQTMNHKPCKYAENYLGSSNVPIAIEVVFHYVPQHHAYTQQLEIIEKWLSVDK